MKIINKLNLILSIIWIIMAILWFILGDITKAITDIAISSLCFAIFELTKGK